jgi:hypothetical protein
MRTRLAHIAQERIRWLGWTLVFTLGLLVWDASLVWFMGAPIFGWPWEHGLSVVVFAGLTLGLAMLAFRIGVRFQQELIGLAVVLAAAILAMVAPLLVWEWPQQGGLALMVLFFPHLLFILPAGAGVWWGRRRLATNV